LFPLIVGGFTVLLGFVLFPFGSTVLLVGVSGTNFITVAETEVKGPNPAVYITELNDPSDIAAVIVD